MIRILEDHPGTRIASARVDGSHVAVSMLREPMTRADWTTHDYNVHFCVGLENASDSLVDVELCVEDGQWDKLPDVQPLLYVSDAPGGPFEPASFRSRTDLRRRYMAYIPLAPGQRIYVANTFVRDLERLSGEFDELAAEGGAARQIIGLTLEGREIIAYRYGEATRSGTVLVTSGFHPPEPDTVATAAIMRHLASPVGKCLVERLCIVVVPISNPDGYANGTQGANAAGINFYWHFARESPARCPEAQTLWKLAEELAPRGYIDFHCYTFQLRKRAGPYQRPLSFYDQPTTRAAARSLYSKLSENGTAVTGFGTYAPHTLGAMLVQRFDTLAVAKYHLHLAEGLERCATRGVEVFLRMTDTLLAYGLVSPASPRAASWRDALRKLRILWAGLIRPNLGWLRRGKLRAIQLDRTGLIVSNARTAVIE